MKPVIITYPDMGISARIERVESGYAAFVDGELLDEFDSVADARAAIMEEFNAWEAE